MAHNPGSGWLELAGVQDVDDKGEGGYLVALK